jgi:hypothetical protein
MSDVDSPIAGAPPQAEDTQWLAMMDDLRKRSLTSIEETAKQLIGLDGLISGIYFGAVVFSDLPAAAAQPAASRALFLAPVVLWLASLVAAVLVLAPRAYAYNPHSPGEARDAYERIIGTKHARLKAALWLFVASLVALAAVLWVYLGLAPVHGAPGTP